MDDLRLYVLFNRISDIIGRWYGDNERLCTMKPRIRLERYLLEAGLEQGSARLVVVFVVMLLFYVHGKHLRPCRDGQLT